MAAAAALDAVCYGRAVCTLCNFLSFNLLTGGSALFGTHPWHWNLSQGLPATLGTAVPLVALGAKAAAGRSPRLLVLAAVYVFAHSLPAHKEFRFLLPVLPLLHAYAGVALLGLWTGGGGGGAGAAKKADDVSTAAAPAGRRRRGLVVALLAANVPAALYLSVWHQAGPHAAVAYLGAQAEGRRAAGRPPPSIAFLTPCHSTPLTSHLHVATDYVPSTFTLDCSPENRVDGRTTESDAFEADPLAFVRGGGAKPAGAIDYVVAFDDAAGALEPWLAKKGFRLAESFFHSHVNGDRDREGAMGDLQVWGREV